MSKTLAREFKFAAALRTERVECPELDGAFILRELTAAQALDMKGASPIAQLALMIVDENGDRIFTTPEDIENLSNLSITITNRLLLVASRLNGIGQAAVDDAIKNLLASPTDASESV